MSVMPSYNEIDGVPSHANKWLLQKLLREDRLLNRRPSMSCWVRMMERRWQFCSARTCEGTSILVIVPIRRGGLARRVGYVEGFKKKFSQTPVLQLEAGGFLYDSVGYSDNVMLQNEQVARAFSRWPVDVINLGRYDLTWARRMLAREGLAERMAALPMLKNLISANGVFEPEVAAPSAFVIKEVAGPRIKGRKRSLRVGFVGLAEPIKPSGGMFDGTVKNMFEVGRQTVLAAARSAMCWSSSLTVSSSPRCDWRKRTRRPMWLLQAMQRQSLICAKLGGRPLCVPRLATRSRAISGCTSRLTAVSPSSFARRIWMRVCLRIRQL